MTICAGENAEKAGAELEAVFAKLIAKISPEGQTALREAKEAWIIYRDTQCAFNSLGSKTGSVHSMVLSECRATLTRDYIALLQAQHECEEGDVSCGGQ